MSDEVAGTPAPETFTENQDTETNAEASIEDAILDLDTEANPDDEVTPKDEPPPPRKLKVKIDGQELEVDEDEAVKGYQRQQDYSRHMQALQAERQQAAQMQARYSQQLEQFIPESVSRINALQAAAEQYRNEGNVEGLAMVQYDLNAEVLRYQQATAERNRIQEESQAQDQQYRQQSLQRAEQAVLSAIPEWKNPETRKAEISEVAQIIQSEVTNYFGDNAPQIMKNINDGLYGPLPLVWARKAMQLDKLMAKVAARKAGKSEETSAPAPVTQIRSSGGASKDPTNMNAKEFAAWRKKQIANR